MTLSEYVAIKNPLGAKKVIESYGLQAVRQPQILARQLNDTLVKHGDEALYRIASVHPDLKLITAFNAHNSQANGEEKKKEDCSCKKEESIFSSAEGQQIKSAVEELKRNQVEANKPKEGKSEKTELLIIGAVAIVGLALVMKK